MARSTAILAIHIVSDATRASDGFKKAERQVRKFERRLSAVNELAPVRVVNSLARMATLATVATGAVAAAGGAVGALGIALAGAGALAAPALGAVILGLDGIKEAAKTISPQFDALKKAVSDTFQKEMTPAFKQLGGLLDSLTPAMKGMASTLSSSFAGVVGVLTGPMNGALNTIVRGGRQFIGAMQPGIERLVTGILNLGVGAASSADVLGRAFGNVLSAIGDVFTKLQQTGQLTTVMDGAAAAINGLGNFIRPVIELVAQLTASMGPVLGQAFTALGTSIAAITPQLAALGQQFAEALVQAIQELTPHLPTIIQGFSQILSGITPLIGPFADLVGAIAPLTPAIVTLAVAFRGLNAVAGVATTLRILAPAMKMFGTNSKAATGALKVFKGIFGGLGGGLKLLAGFIGKAAIAMIPLIVQVWSLTAALLANPITWIVLAIVALIAVIVLIATKTTWFQTAWKAMCTAVVAAWNWVVGLVKAVWQGVVTAFQVSVAWLKGVWDGFVNAMIAAWNWIKSAAIAVWNGIKAAVAVAIGFIQAVMDGFRGVASAVWNGIKAVAVAVWNGIKSAVTTVINTIKGVFNTLKSVGTSVWNAIKGAVDTVKGAIEGVVNAIKSVISWIGNIHFPSPPGWMTSLFSSPGAEFTFQPPSAFRFLPEGFQTFAARGPELTAASTLGISPSDFARWGAGAGRTEVNNTNINIRIEGALDPIAVGRQVESVLGKYHTTTGNSQQVAWK
ncbi:hypothetical protein AAFP35_08260 [Gordonia sp. CPCC 206044]|uniref:phage tail protein n=1 Tax=Gordonia sp. CPCC 206044 TaxID=3140793 RepID=UPI003AF3C7FA